MGEVSVHDVLLQRTDLCVAGTYGTDGIRSIGWYELRLWRTRRDNRSAMRWRGFVGKVQGSTQLCGATRLDECGAEPSGWRGMRCMGRVAV